MPRQTPFELIFAPEALEHLGFIEPKYHGLIRETINKQLCHQPEVATRNRKPLEQPATLGATWEIRFGPSNRFRVLYSVDLERREVQVLAVGIKQRNRLLIGGEEIRL